MKITLPRLLSVALPLGAFSGLALATQSDVKLVPAYPPVSGRTTAAATAAPSSGSTQPLIATCLPAIKDQSGPGCIQASSVPTFGDLLPMSNYFNVTPAAQVGIGTASPAATLHLLAQTGFASLIQDGPDGARVQYRDGGATAWDIFANLGNFAINRGGFDFPFMIDSATANTLMNGGAGNVGIGTSTPTAKLHVNGSARVIGQATLSTTEIVSPNKLRFGAAGENSDDVYFRRYVAGADSAVLELVLGDNPTGGGAANDAFVICTRNLDESNQQFRFQFNSDGNALKPGGGSWGALSDRRAKHDIQPLAGALDKVLALAGKTFEYNDPTALGATEGECVGFIAQEVEQVFPEWVSELSDGTKTLTIRGFEALTVESLRELKTQNDELRAKNAELEARVAGLESVQSEIASLKAALATLVENR